MDTGYRLHRFLDAQDKDYNLAWSELKQGSKQSHWMWYIFPQIDGLGQSDTSKYYAIRDLQEAEDYIKHPVLGPRLINTADPLYQAERALRNRVLLRPIGLPDHAWEMNDERSWHFVATDKAEVVGCVVLVPLETHKAQLIQMAVAQELQGKGIGKLLISELLRFCKAQDIREVICHARENAIPFYAGLGFEVYGEPFEEVGIPHRNMQISVRE